MIRKNHPVRKEGGGEGGVQWDMFRDIKLLGMHTYSVLVNANGRTLLFKCYHGQVRAQYQSLSHIHAELNNPNMKPNAHG